MAYELERGERVTPISPNRSDAPPLVIDDPFTEAQKRQLEEALHFQNALVDLLGEPTEKLEPWALAKIKAMQDALAAMRELSADEQAAMQSALRRGATVVHKARAHPTDPASAMREAAAQVAETYEQPNRFRVADVWRDNMTPSDVYETAAIDVAGWIEKEIRGLPLPTAQPDKRRNEEEIRAEIARQERIAREVEGLSGFGNIAGRIAALRWVLNEQETGR